MTQVCTLGRCEGRVSLSRVAWNGGTPFVRGQFALHDGRRSNRVFGLLQQFGGVCCTFLSSVLSGSSFLVTCLLVLGFGLVFPVTGKEMPNILRRFEQNGFQSHLEKLCQWSFSYSKLMISNFFCL